MSSTNKTAKLGLSQFLGTDKPAWLGDYNSDMQKIDDVFADLEQSGQSSAAEIAALQQRDVELEQSITDVNDRVDTVFDDNITLGNRTTVLEGNYDTMHHEVAIAQQDIERLDKDKSNKLNPQIVFEHNGNESTLRRYGADYDTLGICTIKPDGTPLYGTIVNKEGEFLPDYVRKGKLTSLLSFKTISQEITLAQGEQKEITFTAPSGMIIPTYATAVNERITVRNMYPKDSNTQVVVDVKNTTSSSTTATLYVTCLIAK